MAPALSVLCPCQAPSSPCEPLGCVSPQPCSGRGQPRWGPCPTRMWTWGTWRCCRSTAASRATCGRRSGRAGSRAGGTPTASTPTPLQVPSCVPKPQGLWHRLSPVPCADISGEKWFSRGREAGQDLPKDTEQRSDSLELCWCHGEHRARASGVQQITQLGMQGP